MKQLTLACILSLMLFTSCAHMNKGQKGAIGGAAGGALVGQMIGGNTQATLIGAAVGTMLGYIVGNEMDKYDREQLNRAYERGVSHRPNSWVNPDSGNQYSVVPQPAYQNPATNQVCRNAYINSVIDGKQEQTQTTACRDGNGQWRIQA